MGENVVKRTTENRRVCQFHGKLNGLLIIILFKNDIGRATAQAAAPRLLTAKVRFRPQNSPCGVCGGQSGDRCETFCVLRFSPVSIIPLLLHIH
jgi:hypothetical protein